jgi:hypothetical protein
VRAWCPVETPFDARRDTKAIPLGAPCRPPSCRERPSVGGDVLWQHLTHLASGLTPFDIRPKGYSYAEAGAFLEAIGSQGRVLRQSRVSHRHILSAALCGLAWAGVVVADDAGGVCVRTPSAMSAAYSITSSAAVSSSFEIWSESVSAVFLLMTNSNLAGCTTGISAGLAPLRMSAASTPA